MARPLTPPPLPFLASLSHAPPPKKNLQIRSILRWHGLFMYSSIYNKQLTYHICHANITKEKFFCKSMIFSEFILSNSSLAIAGKHGTLVRRYLRNRCARINWIKQFNLLKAFALDRQPSQMSSKNTWLRYVFTFAITNTSFRDKKDIFFNREITPDIHYIYSEILYVIKLK